MKVKLINNGIMPTRATDGSVGFDLYVPNDTMVMKGRNLVKTGVCIALDAMTEATIRGRSGNNLKGIEGYFGDEPLRFDADVIMGTIDIDYRGEIGVIVNNHDDPFSLHRGQRIAQMVISPVVLPDLEEVDDLDDTERADGGFGHSGS